MKSAKEILDCINPVFDTSNMDLYEKSDVIKVMQYYAHQVAEAVRDEAVNIAGSVSDTERDMSNQISEINIDQFII